MRTTLLIVAFIICAAVHAFPQKEEVNAINNLTLYKKQLHSGYDTGSGSNKTIINFREYGDHYLATYYDKEGRIRKLLSTQSYPEEFGYIQCYYDIKGHLVFLNSYCRSGMNYAINGSIYMNNGILQYLDLEILDDGEPGTREVNVIVQEGGELPANYDMQWRFNRFLHTDSLGVLYNGKKPHFEKGKFRKVEFKQPQKDDRTFTNARKVNLRKLPSVDAPVLTIVDIGTIVQTTGEKDGEWCKVKVNDISGYIRGDLLEPVEVSVTDTAIAFCKAKVDEINSIDLYKETELLSDAGATLYYDALGCIRKYEIIKNTDFEDGTIVDVMYFDERGSLCYRIYYNVEVGESLIGKMYVHDSEILQFGGSAYSLTHNDMWTDFLFYHVPIPFQFNEYKFRIGHTNDLHSHFNRSLKMPENCKKVKFRTPEAGDIAMVSQWDVYIRKEPLMWSHDIAKKTIGNFVTIIETGQKENIEGLGEYHWYKIRWKSSEPSQKTAEGWIFGAFLEPVESKK